MLPKAEIRRRIRTLRRELADKDLLSAQILSRLTAEDFWQAADLILFYVDLPDEVRTTLLLQTSLLQGRKIAVPYCDENELRLTRLLQMQELAAAAFGVQEPVPELRRNPERMVDPAQVDLVLVPGLAFDRHGGRLGLGKGYYDRLLLRLRPDCLRVGLAFACQLIDRVPCEEHDQPVDVIVTERELIRGRRA